MENRRTLCVPTRRNSVTGVSVIRRMDKTREM
jgi:hypothetical protein